MDPSLPETPQTDSPAPPPACIPRRRRRWWLWGLGALMLLVALAAAGGWGAWVGLQRWAVAPWGDGQPHTLVIAPGTGARQICDQLAQAGLVSHSRLLQVWLRLHPQRAANLQAGEYQIKTPLSPTQLLEQLAHGSFGKTLTIPEGWTTRQIARRLVAQGWIQDEAQWLELVARPTQLPGSGAALPAGAEGFCFPQTYRLEKGSSPEAILRAMLTEFERQWAQARPDQREERCASLSMTEVVTLASMIQREARGQAEMPAIASVYLNRLKRKMKLQCCATVHYALGEVWDRALRLSDLKVDSPYNTYLHRGLPPGPISNPGREAVEAVLRPEANDYLFYVYAGQGQHIFSRTHAEHLRAIRQIRSKNPSAAPPPSPDDGR